MSGKHEQFQFLCLVFTLWVTALLTTGLMYSKEV